MWRIQKKLIRTCSLLCCWPTLAMQKPPVIFDVTALVKQDIGGKTRFLSENFLGSYHFGISEIALEWALINTFGVPLFKEHSARLKFFEFLSKIPVVERYPKTKFEGDILPPIVAAWALGKRNTEETMRTAHDYVDAHNYPDSVKKFYHALIYTTFDPNVMEHTCTVDVKAEKLLDSLRTLGYKTYLIGHSDLASRKRLGEKYASRMSKFDKIIFSHETAFTPETTFDDNFWLHQLGLVDPSDKLPNYIFVDDWIAGNVTGDAPPHYTSTSSALKKILAEK